jgi:hypothetical protein
MCLWSHTHPTFFCLSQAMFKGAVFGWAHALCRNAMFGNKGVAASMPDWAIESLAGGMGGAYCQLADFCIYFEQLSDYFFARTGRQIFCAIFFIHAINCQIFHSHGAADFLRACRFFRVVDFYNYPHRRLFCASQIFSIRSLDFSQAFFNPLCSSPFTYLLCAFLSSHHCRSFSYTLASPSIIFLSHTQAACRVSFCRRCCCSRRV